MRSTTRNRGFTLVELLVVMIIIAALAAVILSFAGAAFFVAQRADYGWRPSVAAPTFTANRSPLLFSPPCASTNSFPPAAA